MLYLIWNSFGQTVIFEDFFNNKHTYFIQLEYKTDTFFYKSTVFYIY